MKKILEVSPVIGVLLAVAGVALYGLGQIDQQLMLFIIGFGGFGSLAAVRALIDSSGFKTILVSGIGMLLSVGVGAGLVDASIAQELYAALVAPAAASLAHGLIKQ